MWNGFHHPRANWRRYVTNELEAPYSNKNPHKPMYYNHYYTYVPVGNELRRYKYGVRMGKLRTKRQNQKDRWWDHPSPTTALLVGGHLRNRDKKFVVFLGTVVGTSFRYDSDAARHCMSGACYACNTRSGPEQYPFFYCYKSGDSLTRKDFASYCMSVDTATYHMCARMIQAFARRCSIRRHYWRAQRAAPLLKKLLNEDMVLAVLSYF